MIECLEYFSLGLLIATTLFTGMDNRRMAAEIFDLKMKLIKKDEYIIETQKYLDGMRTVAHEAEGYTKGKEEKKVKWLTAEEIAKIKKETEKNEN